MYSTDLVVHHMSTASCVTSEGITITSTTHRQYAEVDLTTVLTSTSLDDDLGVSLGQQRMTSSTQTAARAWF